MVAQIPFNTIVPGDCISGMSQLPEGSVELAFADPPFNIGYEYDVYQDRKAHQDYLDWSRQWISGVHRALRPDGSFWLAIGDEYAAELKLISQEVGFHCRSWVIWYYTFGVNCARKFSRSHAHLFYFVKDPEQFTFRLDELENRIPSARQLVYNDRRANPKGRLPDDTWIIRPQEVVGELLDDAGTWSPNEVAAPVDESQTWTLRPQDLAERFGQDEDTWYFPRVAGTFKERAGFHGCQMPEQLLGRIIRLCSHEGETVMDPFSGSATTLVVARKLGRRYLGFELSDEYVKHGLSRLDSVCCGDQLHGDPEPTMSAPETFQGKTNRKTNRTNIDTTPSAGKGLEDRYAEAQLELTLSGIRSAFELSHAGYSADRVVVDPEINQQFVAGCERLGLVGSASVWNSLLFRLRKAGKLADVPTDQATRMSWADCDPYLFASELAWQSMVTDQLAGSLDEILVDPDLAAEFDRRAILHAPGFSSLEYRWAALKLRKQSKIARNRSAVLSVPRKKLASFALAELKADQVPDQAGVYVISAGRSERLYAGETLNLRQRLTQHLDHGLQRWGVTGKKSISVQLLTTPIHASSPLAWQACFARTYRTTLNLREFAGSPAD
ncbi:MAG: hypothetical protein KDA58_09245 [Planctomycetaceae bacterium]|nr:hypothetical protein [Planctomycetaceae bacterium]